MHKAADQRFRNLSAFALIEPLHCDIEVNVSLVISGLSMCKLRRKRFESGRTPTNIIVRCFTRVTRLIIPTVVEFDSYGIPNRVVI